MLFKTSIQWCSLLFFLLWMNVYAQHGSKGWNSKKSIPKWVRQEFTAHHLDQEYDITYQLYPSYLEGDFNGDGRNDAAILVHEKSSGKFGIAIVHGKRPQAISSIVTILGADTQLGKAGKDFKWMKVWSLIEARTSSSLPKHLESRGDAIQTGIPGGKTGIIYWDGKKYTWYEVHK